MFSRQIVILLLVTVQSIFGLTCAKYINCEERNCEKNYPGTKCVYTTMCGSAQCQVIERPQKPLTPTHQQKTLKLLESISADVNSLKLLNDNRN